MEEGEIFEMDILWIPEMRAFQEHDEFDHLIAALGIEDYWAQYGCAFIDDRVPCGD